MVIPPAAPLPTNETLLEFSAAIPWQEIERQKRIFNEIVRELASQGYDDELPLDMLSERIGATVATYYDHHDSHKANVYVVEHAGRRHVLGSVVSGRYRSGKSHAQAFTPYNLNPSVNHTNLPETDSPTTYMRALGAEVELGLLHPDGRGPTEDEMQQFITTYQNTARRIGITPQIDREACQYQVEAHVAPGVGYSRTRASLDGIMNAIVLSCEATGLHSAILSAYPIESDFKMTADPKVNTAVDLMTSFNAQLPEYVKRIEDAKTRYGISADSHVVQVFRLQGCHIHLDLAGRSEALGLLAFYTLLRSATAVANATILKGGPFVNGTCDAELLCTREYLRSTTVTGRPLQVPVTPHLSATGLEDYANLLLSERVNAMARALLYEGGLGVPVSAMHNPIGRIRPDLGSTKRICTLESTGMPVNISASRQAAVLTDFEFSHAIIENYFRKYGCDLGPMYENRTLLEIFGPLSPETFTELHAAGDRLGTDDFVVKTAAGTELSLPEFYEKKRIYMHKYLDDGTQVRPRDIDDVYMSFARMLVPPSGESAQTVEQYICDPRLRSTGNWGKILRDSFIEEGGTPGTHNPDAVLRVTNRVHKALLTRYTQS